MRHLPFPSFAARCCGPALSALGMAALLAGCAVGPSYTAPVPAAPPHWQAVLPHQGTQADRAQWWAGFDDPVLLRLVTWAEADSPTLESAYAAIELARATRAVSAAAGLPTLSGSASAGRARSATTGVVAIGNTRSTSLDAAWELDLWGRVRRTVAADEARVAAREADWHSSRVSLAAEVADDYVQYRGCRRLVQAHERSLASRRDTAMATQRAVQAGIKSPSDVSLAEASVASAETTLRSQQLSCDLLVTALAALTGRDEPTLRAQIDAPDLPALPTPRQLAVPAVPADALRQRPDLASLERTLAAASEAIGAAQAQRWPSLSLSGVITAATSAGLSVTTWSFGPALALPLLDGGQRRAQVAQAVQTYRGAEASYRSGVRTAVKEVEQALRRLAAAAAQQDSARRAMAGYQRSLQASEVLYRTGSASLLTLEDSRRNAINAEIEWLNQQQTQVQDWIALYKALGGGWQPGAPAAAPAPASATAAAGTSATDSVVPLSP